MKLVRDNIPVLHDRGELGPHREGTDRSRQVFRRATAEEYGLLLRMKLAEEVGEALSAMTREQLLEELGDLRAVIKAIEYAEGLTLQDMAVRAEKHVRFGAFLEGWVLEWTKEPEKET